MSEGVVLLSTVSADSCTLETSYFIRNEDENGLFPLLKKKKKVIQVELFLPLLCCITVKKDRLFLLTSRY